MSPDSLFAAHPSLPQWTHADQIRFFAWHLHSRLGKETFVTADLRGIYEALGLKQPSSLSRFLIAMCERRPPELLRRGQAYLLERATLQKLDAKFGARKSTIVVERLLMELPAKLSNNVERVYLDEALLCFSHGAFRAAIVMAWNLSFDSLCNYVFEQHLDAFNVQLPRSYPKTIGAISRRDDFAELKESQVVQVCKSAGIVSSSIAKVLKEKLDRRNLAAHPSGVVMTRLTAEEFISDVVQNVVLRLR